MRYLVRFIYLFIFSLFWSVSHFGSVFICVHRIRIHGEKNLQISGIGAYPKKPFQLHPLFHLYMCIYREEDERSMEKGTSVQENIRKISNARISKYNVFLFFSIYRAEGDIEKRWKDIKMTNKLTDFSIWSLYISFLEISKHDEFILLHRREWERERETDLNVLN